MSFSPTGATDIESAVKQMLEQYIMGAQITSSGGDSPKVNRVTILPEVSGFNDLFESAVRIAVIRHMEENGMIGGLPGETGTSQKGFKFGLSDATGFLTNPTGELMSLAKQLVPVLGPLMTAALTPLIMEQVIDMLSAPGMPLDPRYNRDITNEVLGGLTRQQQENTKIGTRNVQIQSIAGFGGDIQYDSVLKQIREGRGDTPFTSKIGLKEKAGGLK